jgi:hypothetical protein
MSGTTTVCLTLDVDWASDEILADALALVDELGVPYTVFCTHSTPILEGLDPARVELAWHPNFLAGRDEAEVLDELAVAFPDAVGVRAHALYFHSRLVPLLLRRGIHYVAHDLRFAATGLHSETHWSGLVNVPGFWEDDVHSMVHGGDFQPGTVDVVGAGLKVFDFHPIHLRLNTDHMARYERARSDIEAGRSLAGHVNPGRGSRSFLQSVVGPMARQPEAFRFATVESVAREHRQRHPYLGAYRPD